VSAPADTDKRCRKQTYRKARSIGSSRLRPKAGSRKPAAETAALELISPVLGVTGVRVC